MPVALALTLAGCGSSASKAQPSGNPSSTTAGASGAGSAVQKTAIAATVPSGTTLRVGDQLEFLKTLLATAGEDTALPYKLEWSGFIGGPPMLQAFHAGAIDAGFVADTPLILAQAAHQDVVAVTAWASGHGSNELIAAPGTGINSWADLKGKKVALQRGTSAEATVLQGLQRVGLKLSDIDVVDLPFTQVSPALQGGSVQAGILVPPLDSAYLTSNPGAKVVDRPDNLTARLSFLIAKKSAIEDPAKAAALRDYILRLGRAFAKIKADPDPFIEKFYVGQYHLSPAAGKALLTQLGASSFVQFTPELHAAQQELADLFLDAGEIPHKVDATQEFDTRFADVVRQAAKG
ncbi:MAG: sulfonate transport system substrate-binding protein [Actinomycetota bacterium]|nr:sulfonate transport system substrate-binding protein [Actinomycetota bacterium]